MAVTRQRSGHGSLEGGDQAMSLRDARGKEVPRKLPESLDFDFWEALIFLPEDRLGGGGNVSEVVEEACRHLEFQMLYIRGQELELSSPIRQASTGFGGRWSILGQAGRF
jgi:hypothetical protein